MRATMIHRLDQLQYWQRLTDQERTALLRVAERYPFRASEFYLSRIDWENPADPLRRIVIPDPAELQRGGRLDPSGEHQYAALPGLEHKYRDTALLLVSDRCGAVCRFCFRKRLFLPDRQPQHLDLPAALAYLRAHPEIVNVLLTGGDPLLLSTRKLRRIIEALRQFDHIHIIRIGSKMPAFDPQRILGDPELLALLREFSQPERRIYLMTHINHPRELSEESGRAFELLLEAGVVVMNQTPLLRGVNDDPETLAELFRQLAWRGIHPYYVFQCRPAVGNAAFTVPLETGYEIFQQALARCSGLAGRARFAMSHASGKVVVAGLTEEQVVFRYHRAARLENEGRTLLCRRNPQARWLDDYAEYRALDDPDCLAG